MSFHQDGRLTKSELQEWYTKLYFDRSDDVAETIRAAVMRVMERKKIQADGKNIVAKALARGYCSFPDAHGNKTELPDKKNAN